MRILLACFFLLKSFMSFSQIDSVTLKFFYLDKDLSLLNELNDIQYIGISCSDTAMRGKRFLLTFDEFRNGKNVYKDTSNLVCREEKIPFVVGDDTIYYVSNDCDYMTFGMEDSILQIRFAGKLKKDTFKLSIDYGAIRLTEEFTGNEKYSFREITCAPESKVRVQLNTLTPVLSYTPPFENDSGMGSYCILGTEKIDSWFGKFKVEHYYIMSLKIE